jgi:tetratricopeptide (TPR) repeat protein
MDKASAERLLRVAPEPEESLTLSVTGPGRPSAAYTSLILWDIVDVDGFRGVPNREPIASEAAMRLGQNYARLARPDLALPELIRAEALATTPYERHLTRLFAGAVLTRMGRKAEAIDALRGALHAVPRASSASFAPAPLLLQVDAREEAAEVLEAAMRLPQVDDPLLAYYAGDPTAVSRALARLRDEARR